MKSYFLRLGRGLSVSPAVWQQFINEVFETIPNWERDKVIIENAIIFSTWKQHFEDLANFLMLWSNLNWKYHLIIVHFLGLPYLHDFHIHIEKTSYTPMKEKCNPIISVKLPRSLEKGGYFLYGQFLVTVSQTFEKAFHTTV